MGASVPCATIIPHFRQLLHKNCKNSHILSEATAPNPSVLWEMKSYWCVRAQSPPLLLSGRAEAFSEDFLGWASLTRPGSLAQGRAAKTLCWENPTDRWSFIQHSCQLFACQPGGVKAKWECLSKTKWECLDCKYILHSAWRSCYSRGRIHGPPLEVWIDK